MFVTILDFAASIYTVRRCRLHRIFWGLAFPCEIKHRIVVFGGHDSWLREIRQKLPDVRFLGREASPNADLIRNADVVWIQANSLAHKHYYKIIDIVRKYNKPVHYFAYASATKCAEQIVLEDRV